MNIPKKTMIYHIAPCKHCGGTARYVSNGNCPTCIGVKNKANRQRYKARRALLSEKKGFVLPTPVKSHTGPDNAPNLIKNTVYNFKERFFKFPFFTV
ncbi:hypothetical protein [Klebsiella aerogenes]|uniref:hypothetical protein n=1 Tax=Klebsiella aerogenes TaxID=548 RepID=UPI00103E2463|nr:hypothetical protein [Klebsiella aerogenes]